MPFMGKFGPKSQNYQFSLKFGTYTNSNMQNSMAVFTCALYRRLVILLLMGVGFAQFQGSKRSSGLFQDFMDGYIKYYDFSQ